MLRKIVEEKLDATACNICGDDTVVHPSTPVGTLNNQQTQVYYNTEVAVDLLITQQVEEDNKGMVNVEDAAVSIIINITDPSCCRRYQKW